MVNTENPRPEDNAKSIASAATAPTKELATVLSPRCGKKRAPASIKNPAPLPTPSVLSLASGLCVIYAIKAVAVDKNSPLKKATPIRGKI